MTKFGGFNQSFRLKIEASKNYETRAKALKVLFPSEFRIRRNIVLAIEKQF